ncbi:MAG: hypothetical protein ABH858_01020 [Candidatus Omnitrophota bacterium]
MGRIKDKKIYKFANDQPMFRDGFTFSEVLVSAGIMGFLALTIFAVLNVGGNLWQTDMILIELQQQSRLALDGMVREIRQSKSSNITISDGGARIDFTIPNVTNTISYYLSGAQIIREHPAGTTRLLANNVTSLQFSLSGEVVTVNLQAGKTYKGRLLPFFLVEKVRLRNG